MSSINIPGLHRQTAQFSALDLANIGAPLDFNGLEEEEEEEEDGSPRAENGGVAIH